jgi:hypothetical protein
MPDIPIRKNLLFFIKKASIEFYAIRHKVYDRPTDGFLSAAQAARNTRGKNSKKGEFGLSGGIQGKK